MAKKSLYKILSLVVDVRPEEVSTSVPMFFYFFLITSSAWIVKPIKVSLYLHWLSFKKLPYAYLLTAILIGFVVSLNSKLLHSMKRHLYISLSLGFFAANLLLFWVLFQFQWKWLSIIYWFWSDIFMVTSVTQFWILINDIYNPRQAKRLVGFFVSGGLLGGIAGSLLASFLAKAVGTENLLLICPAMLLLCLIIVFLVHRFHQREKGKEVKVPIQQKKSKVGYIESFSLISRNRYLLILSGIMASAIVVTTLVDFQFNSVIELAYIEKDSKTAFLGTFFTLLLIFSYILHILITNRILKNFGIRIALLIAPFFLLIGSVAIFLIPAIYLIYWAVLIKGADKSLAHSLSQSVRELLYIPVFPEIKYKAKVFIDMFVNKFAKGLAALLLLLFFSVLQFTVQQISFVTIIFILIWTSLILLIHKEYVGIVKKNLKIKWQEAGEYITEKIDIDTTKLVFDTLDSKKRSSVLYAMNLLDLIKREAISPEVKKLLQQKSNEIRASSMDSLLELDGENLIPEIDDTLDYESLDVQVKEILSLDTYQELMKEHISKIVSEKVEEKEVSRMETAKVLGMMEATSPLIQNLNILLRDESPEVVKYAVESAGKLKRREFVPLIIRQLSKTSIQAEASKALVKYGIKIIGTLKDYMEDPEEDIRLRKNIANILSLIDTQRAADLLVSGLQKKRRDVESEIIEAMYKMKVKNPHIYFQEKIILSEIIIKIKECYMILLQMHDLMADTKKVNTLKSLETNLARSIRHIFELLSLIYAQDDVIKAYQNICVGTKKAIEYSIELLDNIFKKEIMEILLPLIDDIPLEDKVRKCKKLLKTLQKTKNYS